MDRDVPLQPLGALRASERSILDIMEALRTHTTTINVSTRAEDVCRTFQSRHDSGQTHVRNEDDVYLYGVASGSKIFVAFVLSLAINIWSYSNDQYAPLKACWDKPFEDVLAVATNEAMRIKLNDTPTVLDLICHRRGLPSMNDELLSVEGFPIMSKTEFKRRMASFSSHRKGSSIIEYSNANYIWLEILLEEVSQQPIERLLREHVFEPLQMSNTYTDYDSIPEDLRSRVVGPMITSSSGHLEPAEPTEPRRYSSKSAVSLSLGMFSSAQDLNKFYATIRDGLQGRLTLPGTSKDFFQSHLKVLRWIDSTSSSRNAFTSMGLFTQLDSTFPGYLSMNRLMFPNNRVSNYVIQSKPVGRPTETFYHGWSRTGYSGSCYYMVPYGLVVTVLSDTGPFDATDHISRLLIQNLLRLNQANLDQIDIVQRAREEWEQGLQILRGLEDERAYPVPLSHTAWHTQTQPLTRNSHQFVGKFMDQESSHFLDISIDGERLYITLVGSIIPPPPRSRLHLIDAATAVICPNQFSNDQVGDWRNRSFRLKYDSEGILVELERDAYSGLKKIYQRSNIKSN